ncbi:GSCFA domain-containing protein [Tropicimonas marinistellae]|uniref:GSCFA domain-containing protein n=1 Tax=Tropicimonas marinistellae TaxID=1739787 RepID=UPI00082CCDA4|nr:GSCFA domain-containing protein [Tropicimonas marinistellae]
MAETNLERLTALEAYRRASGNNLRRYPSPDKDGDRLYPLATPQSTPSFTMSRDDTVFTIGSCFARNVESALISAGIEVTSRDFDLGPIGESLGFAGNFFNKYSIHSVNNELRWALDRASFPGKDVLYPLQADDSKYSDLQLGAAKLEFSADEILAFRHRFLDVMARAAEADVVIVTLGYVEVWYDTQLGIYLNVAPPPQLARKQPERFEFRVLSYEDVLGGLRELYEILTRYRSKPLRMLLTVSPVPLLSTFRDVDVLVANSYSKSVQRAAIDAFIAETDGVDYFPSYEFVVLSDPRVAWSRGDYRHVSSDLVARIMQSVLARYVPGSGQQEAQGAAPMTAEALEASVRMMLKMKEHESVLALMVDHEAVVASSAVLQQLRGVALSSLDRFEEAFDAMGASYALAPGNAVPLERQIAWCRKLGRKEVARGLRQVHVAAFPDRADFRDGLTWLD